MNLMLLLLNVYFMHVTVMHDNRNVIRGSPSGYAAWLLSLSLLVRVSLNIPMICALRKRASRSAGQVSFGSCVALMWSWLLALCDGYLS